MSNAKQIIITLFQIISMILLLLYLGDAGLGEILGKEVAEIVKVIIEFGVTTIALSGALFGLYAPTRRHRMFRNTQIHLLKYISVLSMYQVLALFMTGTIGAVGVGLMTQLPPIFMNVLMISFSLIAIMMPFNYIKSLFNELKTVEYRDPRNLIKQMFR